MYHYCYYHPIHKMLMKNCNDRKKTDEENTFTAIMCLRDLSR